MWQVVTSPVHWQEGKWSLLQYTGRKASGKWSLLQYTALAGRQVVPTELAGRIVINMPIKYKVSGRIVDRTVEIPRVSV